MKPADLGINFKEYSSILAGCLALNSFILVGNFRLLDIDLGLLFLLPIVICGLAIRSTGSKRQLLCSILVSLLLTLLLSFNFVVNPEWFLRSDVFIGSILIVASPLIGWSFLNLSIPRVDHLSLLGVNLFNLVQYGFVASLAGRNVSYRLAVIIFIVSLHGMSSLSKPKIRLSLLGASIYVLNLILLTLFFVLIFINGSRGGILTLVLIIIVWHVKLSSIFSSVFHFFRRFSFSKSHLLIAVSLPAIAFIAINAIRSISPRAYLIFGMIYNSESVMSQSEGTRVRSEWYGYLLRPADFISSIDLFNTVNPPWGTYPHNILLDSAGNLGIPFVLGVIISTFLSIRRLRFFAKYSRLSYLSVIVLVVAFSSLVSGTIWDYYSVFAALCMLFADSSVRWTGFTGQPPSLTSKAGYRP